MFLGTSLTAGLGVDLGQAYPALIQRRIDDAGLGYMVQNAGVSGETSAGARRRIDWLMTQQPPAVLVIETGANDGLRGLDPDAMRQNLEAIVDRAQQQVPPPRIVIVGMEAPPNMGRSYTNRFREVFRSVAEERGAAYVPFLLDDVAGIDSLNQADGIHPTPAGQRIMAETVWRVLEPLLREPGD
jgi:acyl-CoA thioesterase-1